MAIIINDFEPSGETVEVQLPGSKKRFKIASSDALTIGQLEDLAAGKFSVLRELFPDDAQPLFRALYAPQLEELLKGYMGGDAGNSVASRG